MVPTRTGKNGRAFSSQEKSGNFTQSTGKSEKFRWKTGKNTEKVREICQPVIVKTLQIWYQTLNKKELQKYWKTEKILEKSGKFVSQIKVGTMVTSAVKPIEKP